MTNLIHYYFSAKGVVTSADILSILKEFCGDRTKPADIQREVLQLTEKVDLVCTAYSHVFTVYYCMYTVLSSTRGGAPPSAVVSDTVSVAGAV